MKNLNEKSINNEKGITLLALVITIIILIILSSIAVNVGKNRITESRENTMLSELAMVQHAILQRKTKADLTNEEYPGETITEANINLEKTIEEINNSRDLGEEEINRKDSNDSHYYFLSTENGGLEELGITNSEDAYIVNYETGEVINYTTKLTGTGKPLYIYAKEAN